MDWFGRAQVFAPKHKFKIGDRVRRPLDVETMLVVDFVGSAGVIAAWVHKGKVFERTVSSRWLIPA